MYGNICPSTSPCTSLTYIPPALAVACEDEDVRNVKALIIGPPDTPYQYGFFEFAIKFGSDYPNKPPKVDARTTNSGRCRFNPNIYAGGKVCLSILGTWQGEQPGEEWSSAQGLESILWSIQSLMSNNPYENEPGFENATTENDKQMGEKYCAKIQHETMRIAIIQVVEKALGEATLAEPHRRNSSPVFNLEEETLDYSDVPESPTRGKKKKFEPFNDLVKRRFLWYYETYMNAVAEAGKKYKGGEEFTRMPFEGEGNSMKGKFDYESLADRLRLIKIRIDEETLGWASDGLEAKQQETGLAANLQRQFEQLKERQRVQSVFNVSVELENGNPFVWLMTYFGRPESHLEGGIFKIRISVSPKFPDEQPRVKVETQLYHHRVSKSGVLCYFPQKPEDMRNHVTSVISAIEDVAPPFDPRTTVNPEATKLFWGSADDKKVYNRNQRRCAQRSCEE